MREYDVNLSKKFLYFFAVLLLLIVLIFFSLHVFWLADIGGATLALLHFLSAYSIALDWFLVIPLICILSVFTLNLTIGQIKHKNLLLGEKIFIFSVLAFALVLLVFKVIWWGNALSNFK